MTVLWFTNEGGKFDWSFNAERSASVNAAPYTKPWAGCLAEAAASTAWCGPGATRTIFRDVRVATTRPLGLLPVLAGLTGCRKRDTYSAAG
jgi:hypothetical protein